MEKSFKAEGYSVFAIDGGLPDSFFERVKEILVSEKTPSFCMPLGSSVNAEIFKFHCDEKTYLFKRFLPRGAFEGFKSFFKGSRARRAFNGAEIIEAAGLLTPKVWCLGHKGHLFKGESFIVTEYLEGAHSLYDIIDSLKDSGSYMELFSFMKELGGAAGRLHRAGVIHGDLRPGNVMILADEQTEKDKYKYNIYFIDNERNKKYNQTPMELIVKNLVQLNMLRRSELKFSLRARFYKSYIEEVSNIIPDRKELARTVWRVTEERMSEARYGGLDS